MGETKQELQVNSKQDIAKIEDIAKELIASGMAPKDITWQQLVVIGQRAKEIGIPVMQGMKEIYNVLGTYQLKSELQLELMYKNIPGFSHVITKWTHEEVTAIFYSQLLKTGVERTLTRKYCDTAGWPNGKGYVKDQWKKNPIGMLFNRLISEVARTQFPHYKSVNFNVSLADINESMQSIEDLTQETVEVDGNDVNTTTGEVLNQPVKAETAETAKTEKVVEGEIVTDDAPKTEEKKEEPVAAPSKIPCETEGCQNTFGKNVSDFSTKVYGKKLCMSCQKKIKLEG